LKSFFAKNLEVNKQINTMSALKNQKGVNTLADFITKISGSIKDWNGRFLAKNWSVNDKHIYAKNLRDLIALRDRKLNQSSVNPVQKIIIINNHYSDLLQNKKIDMIMHFVHNKITSRGYKKIRDIATIMSTFNCSLLALKNTCESIAHVNATHKAIDELKQYIDENMNNIATDFDLGDTVERYFLAINNWISGKIYRRNQDGTYDIRYDNGDWEDSVNRKNIRRTSKYLISQMKKQCQVVEETYNEFNKNYYVRLHMQKEFQTIFQKTVLNDDVIVNIMGYL